MTIDISNFYLIASMRKHKRLRVRLKDIKREIISECNLQNIECNEQLCNEIRKGTYCHPQAGILGNKLLEKRLIKAGFYQETTTPSLWEDKWYPIMFTLRVDDFGVECVVK